MVCTDCARISRPPSVPPVKMILRTMGCSTMARPTVRPGPVMMLTVPGGKPASSTISANRRMLSGATIDGLTTIVLPQAIAAEKPRAISFKGVFHGTIWPMTPNGSRRV